MCFDYHENEERKRREQRQAEALRLEQEKALTVVQASKLSTLSRDLSSWGASTTKRIYQVIGAKGGKLPAGLKGDFTVDGFKIRVKKASKAAGPRVFLVVSNRRQVPVGSVGRAKFTAHETRVVTADAV